VFARFAQAVTDSMLFHPERGQPATPADFGVPFEEVWLVADGVRTQAWWMPAEDATVAVVSFHGNAGTMGDRLQHLNQLHALGVSVLAAEYRGYGDSEGSPSEEGLAADARAAAAWVRANAPGLKLVVHGRSLGGAVGIRLADDVAVEGLIVESTFTSLEQMAGRTGIPLAPRLVVYEFASARRIAAQSAPVLVVHGDADELIPVQMGQALADAAPNGRLHVVPGGAHNDTLVRGGAAYWAVLRSFVGAL